MGMVAGTTHVGSISSPPPSPRSDRRTAPGPSPGPTQPPPVRGVSDHRVQEVTGDCSSRENAGEQGREEAWPHPAPRYDSMGMF